MSKMSDVLYAVELPKVAPVRQKLDHTVLADIPGTGLSRGTISQG